MRALETRIRYLLSQLRPSLRTQHTIMKLTHRLAVALALTALACQSTSTPNVVQADAAKRDRLLSAVSTPKVAKSGMGPHVTLDSEFPGRSARRRDHLMSLDRRDSRGAP